MEPPLEPHASAGSPGRGRGQLDDLCRLIVVALVTAAVMSVRSRIFRSNLFHLAALCSAEGPCDRHVVSLGARLIELPSKEPLTDSVGKPPRRIERYSCHTVSH